MKLLITGGAGFIGSNFVDFWLENNSTDSLICFDLMTYAANPITVARHQKKWGKRYEFVKGSKCDEGAVVKVMKGVDIVVNFAAETHVDRSIVGPRAFVETNVLGTLTLLNAARKLGNIRFHHISTDEVFGTLPLGSEERFNADSPLQPRSPYAASKASAEHLVNAFFATYGLPVTMTNCSNNYGPYQFPEKVIPLYTIRALQNKPIPLYGKGVAVRDFLYVEDHCSGIATVIKNGRLGQKYAIGGGAARNTVQVAEMILDILEKPHSLMQFTSDRAGHDMQYLVDPEKIKRELGWKAQEDFQSGIKKTIDWYMNNRDWWEPIALEAESVAENYLKAKK